VHTKLTDSRTIAMTMVAMIAFAGNFLLCRAALAHTDIDPANLTSIRLVSGALVLWLVFQFKTKPLNTPLKLEGDWWSAISLFSYAAAFSFAYLKLTTATGALLLFGSVQLTMLGHGLAGGERLRAIQFKGLLGAFSGLLILLLPGVESPPIDAAVLMVLSGFAWGIYSIQGRNARNPIAASMGSFTRSIIPTICLSTFFISQVALDIDGVLLAIASGALASGFGYVVWYAVLPKLATMTAASVQLSVPIIAGLGGVIFVGELISLRLLVCSVAVLGGIAVIILCGRGSSARSTDK
jgi:drug/metabolite transporter (DMT)-like permease